MQATHNHVNKIKYKKTRLDLFFARLLVQFCNIKVTFFHISRPAKQFIYDRFTLTDSVIVFKSFSCILLSSVNT